MAVGARARARGCCAARKHGLKVRDVETWLERFELGAENALRSRPRDEKALRDEEIKRLEQKIGELVVEIIRRCRWPWGGAAIQLLVRGACV